MGTDAETYRSIRATVIALAREHAAEMDQTAPAVPDWRVRDVVAHLAGVADDVVNGNLDGVATDRWTAVQVDKRRAWSIDALLEDWETHGAAVDTVIDGTPDGTFGQLLFDAWTHEQDVRGALAVPGNRSSPAAAASFGWACDALDARDRGDGRAGLALVADGATRVVGVEPEAATVRSSRFELLRAMTGRRSVAQVRALDWAGPCEPDRLVLGPIFRPPARDLVE